MNAQKLIESLDFSPSKEELLVLKDAAKIVIEILKKESKRDCFIGGSFAKGTIKRSNSYDIDMYVKFNDEDEILKLEKIVKSVSGKVKKKYVKIHGSRDYFRIIYDSKFVFEIIPVLKIGKPREMKNVTDLSYFHVSYVKKKANPRIAREILIAKAFCEAQNVYGAESYIKGFSGYGLECLMIHYKSFLKMMKEMIKINGRIIIDPEKQYKKGEAMIELNESKLKSPIVLVDPTWKERNALAALSSESFEKFKTACKAFLGKPDKKFFEIKIFDEDKFKKKAEKHGEFLKVKLETDRQEGDIAGTKMKKFSDFIVAQMEKYFDIIDREFTYGDEKQAELYLIVKPKKQITIRGPPIEMESECIIFQDKHKSVFKRDGRLWALMNTPLSGKVFLHDLIKKNGLEIFGITGMKIN